MVEELNFSLITYFLIGIGGFFGAILRVYISSLALNLSTFPIATLGINLIGSFVMGCLFAVFQNHVIDLNLRVMVTTGFLGAFTTYATFSLESINLFMNGNIVLGILNMLLNVIGSVTLAFIGFKLFIS